MTVIICGSRISSFCESLKVKGKLCVVQPKTVCRSSHQLGADGNFGTHISRFRAFGVFEHECNVTIVFDFYLNEAASEGSIFVQPMIFYQSRASKTHSAFPLLNRMVNL